MKTEASIKIRKKSERIENKVKKKQVSIVICLPALFCVYNKTRHTERQRRVDVRHEMQTVEEIVVLTRILLALLIRIVGPQLDPLLRRLIHMIRHSADIFHFDNFKELLKTR
jgi:hypothetical protein